MTSDSITKGGIVSEVGTKMEESDIEEEDLDLMVQRASVPNLAALFKAGKDAGLIKPGKEYGNTA